MKKKLLELLKDYNQRTGHKLKLGELAILVYGERPIGEKSMKVAFSRLINGKRKLYSYGEIERLGAILQLPAAKIHEIFGSNKNIY